MTNVRLISLNMNFTQLDDGNWVSLESLSELQELEIGRTQVSKNLRALSKFSKLRRLNLEVLNLATLTSNGAADPEFAEAVVDAILKLRLLESLEVQTTTIDETQFRRLTDLPNLRFLDFRQNDPLQAETIAVLRAGLPNCVIPTLLRP